MLPCKFWIKVIFFNWILKLIFTSNYSIIQFQKIKKVKIKKNKTKLSKKKKEKKLRALKKLNINYTFYIFFHYINKK